MKVLVVGGGGREHTIVWKLSQSPKITKLYCAPGNGGISGIAECVPIKAMDLDGILTFSKENKVDMVVVAPDDPLAAGLVDKLTEAGIRAFGPVMAAAIIEGSKAFSKDLMKKYNIPTAGYMVFDNCSEALQYLDTSSAPIVVKADGLALGKGVIIAQTIQDAKDAVNGMMKDKVFGDAGSRVVIEEFIQGPEVSILAFTDGNTIVPMVSSQDHKRAFDNDQGPNTGGMGTFSPSPLYDKKLADYCMKEVFMPTVEAMNKEGRKFKGVLYFGLMITKDGPKVLEYNARFGDPETQVVLPRLKTDLLEIFEAIIDEKLSEINIEWDDNSAVCVIAASGGYPGKYATGIEINGIDKAEENNETIVFHAGTSCKDGKYYTAGGRVLGVTAVESTMDKAIQKAYAGIAKIQFEGMHYRKDIGRK
ncbi:phosphoribosylamine/glycine ligase [Ruminiclostridium papyrosolvens DSM 2782]|uniref:Phosphoribosylamine--glycine ligase n=1 Tax=Ruminiclostridium papyrosolvens DSM 2782 TaxID=588581 RepID=F1TH78_9FIRM|nr:phosphoribosylamine--glycine ligase [Ruminiclostridium papyrosolvens]EGD46318.1 phosphoribosylamine/glycine ligase [Ruminiclostridium papyrosolvens DSM 2782]WES36629.1 phosphoribosylamine--glycine ligase [Ruminiclostridium papyrosolvens DSM 2782]